MISLALELDLLEAASEVGSLCQSLCQENTALNRALVVDPLTIRYNRETVLQQNEFELLGGSAMAVRQRSFFVSLPFAAFP